MFSRIVSVVSLIAHGVMVRFLGRIRANHDRKCTDLITLINRAPRRGFRQRYGQIPIEKHLLRIVIGIARAAFGNVAVIPPALEMSSI